MPCCHSLRSILRCTIDLCEASAVSRLVKLSGHLLGMHWSYHCECWCLSSVYLLILSKLIASKLLLPLKRSQCLMYLMEEETLTLIMTLLLLCLKWTGHIWLIPNLLNKDSISLVQFIWLVNLLCLPRSVYYNLALWTDLLTVFPWLSDSETVRLCCHYVKWLFQGQCEQKHGVC